MLTIQIHATKPPTLSEHKQLQEKVKYPVKCMLETYWWLQNSVKHSTGHLTISFECNAKQISHSIRSI